MATPPGSEARRVRGFPSDAGANPPPELDDRQGVFDALCVPAHRVFTPEATTPRLSCRGSPGQEVTRPTALDTPRLRLRRASARVLAMSFQSPAGHDGRETSKDRHGEMTAVCGFFMRLRACVAASSYTSMPGG
jgi:hypothetical protein